MGPGHGQQTWVLLSILAAWISFAGIFGLIRKSFAHMAGLRPVAVITAGCLALVVLGMLQNPFIGSGQVLFAASFPAGVGVGALALVARI